MRWVAISATFAILALLMLAVSLAFRSADQRQLEEVGVENCLAIESLKKILRPDPFDEAATRLILKDIGIDPESETGQRLLKTSRDQNVSERLELAPKEC